MRIALRLTGLSADALRAWERRYGAVKPQRTSTGRRVYTEAEVQRLKLLADLVRRGHTIGKIARLSDRELITLSTRALESHSMEGLASERGGELQGSVERLMAAVDAFQVEQIRIELVRVRHLTSPRAFALETVPQLMFLVGQRIEKNLISISQEHALSELIQSQLRQIYEDLGGLIGEGPSAPSVILCTREGDPHDFGLLMAAILFRYYGYRTHYLGRSLPLGSLREAIVRLRPRAVVLGLSVLPSEDERISPAEYLRGLDGVISTETELWMGGSATRTIQKRALHRDLWIFESIAQLEVKLRANSTPKLWRKK